MALLQLSQKRTGPETKQTVHIQQTVAVLIVLMIVSLFHQGCLMWGAEISLAYLKKKTLLEF